MSIVASRSRCPSVYWGIACGQRDTRVRAGLASMPSVAPSSVRAMIDQVGVGEHRVGRAHRPFPRRPGAVCILWRAAREFLRDPGAGERRPGFDARNHVPVAGRHLGHLSVAIRKRHGRGGHVLNRGERRRCHRRNLAEELGRGVRRCREYHCIRRRATPSLPVLPEKRGPRRAATSQAISDANASPVDAVSRSPRPARPCRRWESTNPGACRLGSSSRSPGFHATRLPLSNSIRRSCGNVAARLSCSPSPA